ncbi:MAG: DUF11 domain-containing protein [Ktedonobacteraceae bacterium]
MKRFSKSKLLMCLTAFLMLAAAIVIPLSGNIIGSHAQSASTLIIPSNITGKFFTNTDYFNGVFDRTPSDTPVFTQNLPVINFNPSDSPNCAPQGQDTRPFTDVVSNANGTCTPIIAQGNGAQAGALGTQLETFETEFGANLIIPSAGTLTSTLTVDDGWILCIGPNSKGNQPTPDSSNPINNPPQGNKCPFTGYPEMGDNNGPSSPTPNTVKVNFPAAGTYPIELDYTECCGGSLTLVMSNSFTATPPPNPSPTMTSTQADLSISQTVSPRPLVDEQAVFYTLTVTNNGPDKATNVQVTDTLPNSILVLLFPTSTQGTCINVGTLVSCNLGTLVNGASAKVFIDGAAEAQGDITNKASVQGNEHDPNKTNNTTTLTTNVLGPNTITTDASCSNPVLVALIPDADTEVSGTINLTTTDSGGPAAEAKAGHFLLLKENFGPFTQTIKNFNTDVFFHFKAAENQDQLTACILPGADKKGPDGDEKAIITVTSPQKGLQNNSDFLSYLGNVAGCAADFGGGGLTGEALKHISDFVTFAQTLQDIKEGKATLASIEFDTLGVPFRSCVEALLIIFAPGSEDNVRACLTGGTPANRQCRRHFSLGLSDILIDPIVFIPF